MNFHHALNFEVYVYCTLVWVHLPSYVKRAYHFIQWFQAFAFEMETSIVEMEVNHQKSDSTPSAPRPLGMLIRINSIAIDLGKVAEEDTQKHEHFSIR